VAVAPCRLQGKGVFGFGILRRRPSPITKRLWLDLATNGGFREVRVTPPQEADKPR
jgi:hypothetical protein